MTTINTAEAVRATRQGITLAEHSADVFRPELKALADKLESVNSQIKALPEERRKAFIQEHWHLVAELDAANVGFLRALTAIKKLQSQLDRYNKLTPETTPAFPPAVDPEVTPHAAAPFEEVETPAAGQPVAVDPDPTRLVPVATPAQPIVDLDGLATATGAEVASTPVPLAEEPTKSRRWPFGNSFSRGQRRPAPATSGGTL